MEKLRLREIQVLFWGTSGEFSYLVLQGLLQAGVQITGVVVPATKEVADTTPIIQLEPEPIRSLLPMRKPFLRRNIIHMGWELHVPVLEVRHLASLVTIAELARVKATVAMVACFPWRIPPEVLALPPEGFLNLHPSLLPEIRGPYPLFWTFRLGKQQTGTTIHYMDIGMDTGDIVLQREVSLSDGISGPVAEAQLAKNGAELFASAYRRLTMGTLPRFPQSDRGSGYSRPTRYDFHIPTTWSARRVYNFMRGTAEWGQRYLIEGSGIDLSVRHAISFNPESTSDQILLRDGRDVWIQFTPGVLHARQ